MISASHCFNSPENIDAKYPSCFSRARCPASSLRLSLSISLLVLLMAPLCASGENPHPRISELCADTFRGLEGDEIKGFRLVKAFVTVTPGHTSAPSNIVTALEGHRSEKVRAYPEVLSVKKTVRGTSTKTSFKVFEALPSASNGKRDVDRAAKVYREKEKQQSRAEGVKTDQEELSVLGVIQMIKLGEFLARRYFENLKSVVAPPGENKNLAETTGELVHFQTLSAFLHGLLMEKQFVAADVAKVGASFCQAAGHLRSLCTASHKALQHTRFFVEEAFRKESLLFKNSKLSELNIAALLSEGQNDLSAKEAISHVANTLCAKRHHRRVVRQKREEPEQFPNDHIALMFDISDAHISYLASSKVFQSFAKSNSFSLLSYADRWLSCALPGGSGDENKSCNDKNDMKIISVDPLSMLSLLSALSLPSSHHILPASRLVIETFYSNHSLHSQSTEVDIKLLNDTKNLGYLSKQALQGEPSPPHFPHINRMEGISGKPDTSHFKGSIEDSTDLSSKFVRVLYNGQVVTSKIIACAPYSTSNGLCPYNVFKSMVLDLQPQFGMVTPQNRSEL